MVPRLYFCMPHYRHECKKYFVADESLQLMGLADTDGVSMCCKEHGSCKWAPGTTLSQDPLHLTVRVQVSVPFLTFELEILQYKF